MPALAPEVELLPVKVEHALLARRVAAFFQEVPGQVVGVLIARYFVQAEQREFDLGMSGIAMPLVLARSKDLTDKADILLDWLEQVFVFVVLVMCQRGFNQMATIVASSSC
jgi:hypothetical protein